MHSAMSVFAISTIALFASLGHAFDLDIAMYDSYITNEDGVVCSGTLQETYQYDNTPNYNGILPDQLVSQAECFTINNIIADCDVYFWDSSMEGECWGNVLTVENGPQAGVTYVTDGDVVACIESRCNPGDANIWKIETFQDAGCPTLSDGSPDFSGEIAGKAAVTVCTQFSDETGSIGDESVFFNAYLFGYSLEIFSDPDCTISQGGTSGGCISIEDGPFYLVHAN